MEGDSDRDTPAEGGRAAWLRVQDELRAGLARLEARQLEADTMRQQMAADLRRVSQVVGLAAPTPSVAPQARTYQLRTLVTASVGMAAGVAFDKLVALLASLVAHL